MLNRCVSSFVLSTVILSTSVLAVTSEQEFITSTIEQASQQSKQDKSNLFNTVKAVLNASVFINNTPVTLVGNISRYLGDDNYKFTDKTGSIIVDIDNEKWNGTKVIPGMKVLIHGDIEKGINNTLINVDYIRFKGNN
ncbi:NirD/YgiW/YdeI family stress tolerance protein [Photobacterium leiognathi]|uniref:NirD/YgiW/YdeI family stress tolerance protein n=1 Tax=Photobacterium leiognathi TaxID=553611 RepID=UPI002739591A|nr:NirD/YgiW/YdeI family stress tolerance protein [Photobacterium leiognathi]